MRFPGLDALRGLAVAMVLLAHCLRPDHPYVMVGDWGVRLFFVLSGFLITTRLLAMKALPLKEALWTFHTNRALRILPAYACTLGALLALGYRPLSQHPFPYLTFTSNWWYAADPWRVRPYITLAPTWSLSVEEQFYALWPLLILLTPRQRIPRLVVLVILVSICWKMYAEEWHWKYWTTPGCMDSLGLGALLASLGAPAHLLPRCAPLERLGSISYGLYLYHWPVLWVIGREGFAVPERGTLVHAVVLLSTTLVVATLSWCWIESPLLSLKRPHAQGGALAPSGARTQAAPAP